MERKWWLVLAGMAAIVAVCAFVSVRATTGAHPKPVDPAQVNLSLADFPAGYALDSDKMLGTDATVGLVAESQRSFRRTGSTGSTAITTFVLTYKDDASAHAAFAQAQGKLPADHTVLSAGSVGDERLAVRQTLPGGGTDLVTLVFRRGSTVVSVLAGAPPGTVDAGVVAGFAATVDKRIG